MRWYRLAAGLLVLTAVAAVAGLRVGTAGPQSPQGLAAAGSGRMTEATTVDIELVLAVDVSYSMDPDEQALQREGYAAALTSSEFLEALRTGIHLSLIHI